MTTETVAPTAPS